MALRTRFSLVVAGLAAAGAAVVAYVKRDRIGDMCRSLKKKRNGDEGPEAPTDDVDQAERDSFPASDPPSYGPGL